MCFMQLAVRSQLVHSLATNICEDLLGSGHELGGEYDANE